MTPPIPEDQQFFAVYRAQIRVASQLIWRLTNPATTYAVFIEVLCAMHHNKGYIRFQPSKFATELGIGEDAIHDALYELNRLGILIEHPEGWEEAGKFAVNPHIAWKGSPATRVGILRTVKPITETPTQFGGLVTAGFNVIHLKDCI